MKKLITGIVAMFCLQAAFIVYQAITPLPDAGSIAYIGGVGDEVMGAPALDRLSAEAEFTDDQGDVLAADDDADQAGPVYAARYIRHAPARTHYRRAGVAGVRINRSPALPLTQQVIFKNEYAAVILWSAF